MFQEVSMCERGEKYLVEIEVRLSILPRLISTNHDG